VAGVDAGITFPISSSQVVIGRREDCDVVLSSPTVSRRHAELKLTDDGRWQLTNLSSRASATYVDGRPLDSHATATLDVGQFVTLGSVAITITRNDGRRAAVRNVRPDGTIALNRPPRRISSVDSAPLAVPQAPTASRGPSFNIATIVTPIIGAALGFVLLKNVAYLALAGLTPLMVIGNFVEQKTRGRFGLRRELRRYHRELAEFEAALNSRFEEDKRALRAGQCDPSTAVAWSVQGSPRLWERRPAHGDFLQTMVGIGSVTWQPQLATRGGVAPEVGEVLSRHATFEDVPIVADLNNGGLAGITGEREASLAAARSLLCQVAVTHGPADVRIAVFASEQTINEWDWVKWLPHTKAVGTTTFDRLTASGLEASGELVKHLVSSNNSDDGGEPVTLVVTDDIELYEGRAAPLRRLLLAGRDRVSGIVVCAEREQLPAICSTVLTIHDPYGSGSCDFPASGIAYERVLSVGMSVATARLAARALAKFDDPERHEVGAGLPSRVRLLPLLDPPGLDPEAITKAWQARNHGRGNDPGLNAPIGIGEDGVFILDLIESGPHGIIGGTTGSGKSELLRTIVSSLALTNDAEHLNMAFIDFKGEGSFREFSPLPHFVGMVTDLSGSLAERALVCLEAELKRREEIFSAAGSVTESVKDIRDYYRSGSPLGPLPRLLVLIDEFESMKRGIPDSLVALDGIAMRGRALGVHLLLATQNPSGAITEPIRVNARLRIALRYEDRQHSVDVIGVPDATSITHAGRCFVRTSEKSIFPVQPALLGKSAAQQRIPPVILSEFRFGTRRDSESPRSDQGDATVSDLTLLLDSIRAADRAAGITTPRKPWPDPLPARIDLSTYVMGNAEADPASASSTEITFLRVDDPPAQTQRPAGWDLTHGNLLIAGKVGSGATTALASVACSAATSNSPNDLHLYIVDMAAGGLSDLGSLPHTGAYIAAGDKERQIRLIAFLRRELDRRKIGAQSAAPPRIVVLIDNLPGLLAEYDDLAGMEFTRDLTRVVQEGPSVDILFAATVDRAGARTHQVLASTSQRLVLELADQQEYGPFGLQRGDVPKAFLPGRAVLVEARRQAQVLFPDPTVAEYVAGIAQRWPSVIRKPVQIGALPAEVDVGAIVDGVQVAVEPWLLPMGVGERELAAVALRLYQGEHAIIAGPPRSGRSTALVTALSVVQAAVLRLETLVIAPRPSPLRDALADHVAVSVPELGSDLRRVAADTAPCLVLIDDAELVDDPDGLLATLLQRTRPHLHILAAGRYDAFRGLGQWPGMVRKSKVGILLRPSPESDSDLLGVNLPLRRRLPNRPGCGYLVQAAEFEVVQVALPNRRPLV
jgi:S-DNA-T family DNA segregation ATPase FtsK/SpoIIIE